MAGIKKLDAIYASGGLLEAKKYLEGQVTVTEKLDAHRFSFQLDENKKLLFFKKNDNRNILKIDRIVSDLYEMAIQHIENLSPIILKNIPSNTRFGFSYFPSKKPLRLNYNDITERLVLTDISLRSEQGKVKKVYEDKKYLDNWADVLQVSRSPIIMQGILSENQISHLLRLSKGSESTDAFFAQHIKGIFGNTYSNSPIIEGIVIKNKNGLVQLRDPSYKIFNDAVKPDISRDFYDLTIIQIQEFLSGYDFPLFNDFSEPEERYLKLVYEAYNDFIDAKLINEDFNADYLKPKIIGNYGSLGRKFIDNPGTLERINRSKLNEELFKVFLLSLNKKKTVHGLLNTNIVNNFNRIVEEINTIVNKSGTLTYHESNKIFENEKVKIKDQQPNYIKIVSSLQKAFTKDIKHVETEELSKGICIISKFNFVNKEIDNLIKSLHGENIILVIITKDNIKLSSEVFQMEDEDIVQIIKDVQKVNSNVKEVVKTSTYSLQDIIIKVRESGYEPIKFYVQEESIPNYSLQYNTIKHVLGDRLKISEDFDIASFSLKSDRAIFRSIEDNDYVKFKENSPENLKNFWDIYKSRYNIWSKN